MVRNAAGATKECNATRKVSNPPSLAGVSKCAPYRSYRLTVRKHCSSCRLHLLCFFSFGCTVRGESGSIEQPAKFACCRYRDSEVRHGQIATHRWGRNDLDLLTGPISAAIAWPIVFIAAGPRWKSSLSTLSICENGCDASLVYTYQNKYASGSVQRFVWLLS